jgi:hypothetical protein
MDSSSLVGQQDYTKEKDFVKTIARYLSVSSGKSRGFVITYGYRTENVAAFNGYRNVADFERAVDAARYLGGGRRLDRVLDAAKNALSSSRLDVPKIVVLLTAGRHTPAADAKRLDEAAKPLRDLGARTYVVAIGRTPNKQELRPIVQRPEDIVEIDRFDGLKSTAYPTAKHIVDRSGMSTSKTIIRILCGVPGLLPGLSVICELSLLLVLSLASVFLLVRQLIFISQ